MEWVKMEDANWQIAIKKLTLITVTIANKPTLRWAYTSKLETWKENYGKNALQRKKKNYFMWPVKLYAPRSIM